MSVWKLVVIAVFTGYGSKFSEVLLGFEPHTVVDNNGLFNDFAPTYDKIKAMPEVEWVTPLVTGHVVFEFDNRRLAPIMRAIEPPTPGSPADLRLQKKIARRPAPDPATPCFQQPSKTARRPVCARRRAERGQRG